MKTNRLIPDVTVLSDYVEVPGLGFHSQRMRRIIGNVDGRRLPYKPLSAR